MQVIRFAAGVFILCLATDTLGVVEASNSPHLGGAVINTTPSSPPHQQKQDQQPQSTVTSYKSVVIHHHGPSQSAESQQPSNSSSTPTSPDGKQDLTKESSRSEMYFTMHNSHAQPRQPEDHTQRSTKVPDAPKVQRSPDLIKITRFEGDFRPMMNYGVPENQRRPQRLTSSSYSSLESDESLSSDELPSRYTGHSSEEDYKPKYEKSRIEKPKHEHPTPEIPYRNEAPKRYQTNPAKSHRGTQSFTRSPPIKAYKVNSPPPGMTEELMDALLQQKPQTFESEKHKRTEQKKKFKSNGSPTTFNVGYSIGFGQPPPDDVVVGKPKDVKLHVNGQASIWKQLNDNVEMSQDLNRNKESVSFRVSDTVPRTAPQKFNVFNNNGQSVLYLNKDSPTIDSVPTAGRTSFDHNRALTHSNLFDISNAMASPPIALPLTSNFVPERHPRPTESAVQPKGRELDIMSLYQSMGYSAPVPVLLPGSKGEAQMVHAIVIPIQSMPQLELNWPHFPAMYSHQAPAIIAAPTFIPAFPTSDGAYANVITQPSLQRPSPPSPAHSNRQTLLPTPITHQYSSYNHYPHPSRAPKSSRRPKDVNKLSASFSSPIVVAPTTVNLRPDRQQEQATLNAILAEELSRKNRHMPLSLQSPHSMNSS